MIFKEAVEALNPKVNFAFSSTGLCTGARYAFVHAAAAEGLKKAGSVEKMTAEATKILEAQARGNEHKKDRERRKVELSASGAVSLKS
jgi:hypothetical protein